jgi:hypothetical protein
MISDFQDSPEFGQALPPIDPTAHPPGAVELPQLIYDAPVDPLLGESGPVDIAPFKLWVPTLKRDKIDDYKRLSARLFPEDAE